MGRRDSMNGIFCSLGTELPATFIPPLLSCISFLSVYISLSTVRGEKRTGRMGGQEETGRTGWEEVDLDRQKDRGRRERQKTLGQDRKRNKKSGLEMGQVCGPGQEDETGRHFSSLFSSFSLLSLLVALYCLPPPFSVAFSVSSPSLICLILLLPSQTSHPSYLYPSCHIFTPSLSLLPTSLSSFPRRPCDYLAWLHLAWHGVPPTTILPSTNKCRRQHEGRTFERF